MALSIQNDKSDDLFDRIDYGVRRGAARALAEHKRAGRSIVIWRDGKVVKIPPEEIEIPAEFRNVV
jgi:hypothetical protein